MVQVQLLKAISNELIQDNVTLAEVPHEGAFLMLSEQVEPDWKNKLYKVVNVTFLIGGKVVIHIEKYDQEKELRSYNEVLKRLFKHEEEQEVSEVEEARKS